MGKKKPLRNIWLRKLLRVHATLTGFSLGAYLLFAFFDPGLLAYDLRQRYQALANETIAITATVLGPPEQPVVSATAECNDDTGVLSVVLDWADDTNTYTYDVDRDSLPLVTGLTVSGYTDLNVAVATMYEYIVTANGPMGPGFAASVPVTVTTPSECIITAPAPSVSILSFSGRAIASYDGRPSVSDRRPVFSGTTTIPNATIQVVVGPKDNLIAQLSANSNGYWEWRPPTGFVSGTQTFTVTALDPDDATRQASASLQFTIEKKEKDDEGGGTDDTPVSAPVSLNDSGGAPSDQQSSLGFSVLIQNDKRTVSPGQALDFVAFITHIAEQYHNVTIPFRFSIVDEEGDVVASLTHDELLDRERQIRKQLDIPSYVVAGKYFLQTEFLFDHLNVSQVEEFSIVELPLIHLGGGLVITYPEIIRNLGWITFILLLLLLLWLFLFIREYGMSLCALRHITEKNLRKAGLLAKRKGAIR